MKTTFAITTACSILILGPVLAEEQRSPTVQLRAGSNYYFTQSVNNDTQNRVGLDRLQTSFTEQADFNGGENPDFSWTDSIKENEYIVDAGETNVLVARSAPLYEVRYFPESRGPENIVIKYTITYFEEINGQWVNPKDDIHIQSYEITYCGDGIIDRYKDVYTDSDVFEQCDPRDQSHSSWGANGCSATCEAMN